MKKIVLLIITAIAVVTAWAQDTARYLPAFEAGQYWTEGEIGGQCAATICVSIDSTPIQFGGMEYYKLHSMHNEVDVNFYHSIGNILRQTENHAKVYLSTYPDILESEFLVYDMDLNEGDTLCNVNWRNEVFSFVVDSMYQQDGRKHIRFTPIPVVFTSNSFIPDMILPFEFIEGVGPTWGWMWPSIISLAKSYSDARGALLCVWRDGEQVNSMFDEILKEEYCFNGGFPSSNENLYSLIFGDCDWGGIQQSEQAPYTLYPNPVTEKLTIEDLPEGHVRIEIYNTAGCLLLSRDVTSASTNIDLSHLCSQTLIVRVTTEEMVSTNIITKL